MSNELIIEEVVIGTGTEITNNQTAVVHYTGTLEDGTKFDSSKDRNDPFSFHLGAGEVIKGWDAGVIGMKIGGHRKLIIPSHMAYGDYGIPQAGIPGGATLIFEVELLGIE
jgi:FKBP-type peptidyl-prolyl cis-trans isomerase